MPYLESVAAQRNLHRAARFERKEGFQVDASVALAASASLPENVNYSVKSSFLLSFFESAPEVSAKRKEPITADRKFDDVVQSAQQAAALVLVY